MPAPSSRVKKPASLQGGFRSMLKRRWRGGKVNVTKFYVRHFGTVPYYDVEKGKAVDLRPLLLAGSRAPGISGFMRLKNEEEFVETAIESVIDGLDELVVVFNGCTDRTPDIVESCRQRYPDKIRVFEYMPEIAQPGSVEHQATPMGSPHSMVNYYNYALVKTTRKIAIKIDGDERYFREAFKHLATEIREGKHKLPLGVSGVNLWDEDGDVFVNARHPVISGLDRGFFTVSPLTFFVHYPIYELFTYAFVRSAGVFYFHLKGLKRDRGLGNYFLDSGRTPFSAKKLKRLQSPDLLSWEEFHSRMGNPEGLPDPASLGLCATVRTRKDKQK